MKGCVMCVMTVNIPKKNPHCARPYVVYICTCFPYGVFFINFIKPFVFTGNYKILTILGFSPHIESGPLCLF